MFYLQQALQSLQQSGAEGVPSEFVIEDAKVGSTWSGAKKDGGSWALSKNGYHSYQV